MAIPCPPKGIAGVIDEKVDQYKPMAMDAEQHLAPTEAIAELVSIVAQLRDPKGGCPWDLEQTHTS